jgi:hypothetical protein
MPEYIQSEGIDAVLDTLEQLGATAVTTSPYVAMRTEPELGLREPPLDAGAGQGRKLDRPLWGLDEVWMATAPSFKPDLSGYGDGPYAPDAATDLTSAEGLVIKRFLARAKQRGFRTYLQVMAAIPPCYRVQFGSPIPEDQPMMANGRTVPARVDRNATLASNGLRTYLRGMIRDLCRVYPECDGLKFDWPEYPPYEFQSLLADYNPQVAPYAAEIGLDLGALAKTIATAQPDPAVVEHLRSGAGFDVAFADFLNRNPAFADHFRLRRHLTVRFAEFLRAEVDAASDGRVALCLQGFPPPWHQLSGFDPKALSTIAHELSVKFYTMHWPMIGANYVKQAAPLLGVSEAEATGWFRSTFLQESAPNSTPLSYPDPDTPHGIGSRAIAAKMQNITTGGIYVAGIAHSYGPIPDVVARFSALYRAANGRVDINRYAYLSEAKCAALANAVSDLRRSAKTEV